METDVFRDKENQILKEEYVYPEVSEKVRQSALLKSLQVHHYNVDIFDSSKTAQHFCRFSGGGDLYITRDNISTLVFVSPGDEDSPAADKNSLAANVDSPAADEGESRLLSCCIEVKKHHSDIETLKYQLWANMIIVTVKLFTKSVHLFTKQQLLDIQELTGYGMACSDDGIFGSFKLEMKFVGGCTTFVTKIKLGRRDVLKTAALMDFTFKYCM